MFVPCKSINNGQVFGPNSCTHQGLQIFNPVMSNATSTALWIATIKALGLLKDNLYTSTNGNQLWNLIESTLVDIDTSISVQLNLDRNFLKLSKHQNETVPSYTMCFDQKLADLKYKGFTTFNTLICIHVYFMLSTCFIISK